MYLLPELQRQKVRPKEMIYIIASFFDCLESQKIRKDEYGTKGIKSNIVRSIFNRINTVLQTQISADIMSVGKS